MGDRALADMILIHGLIMNGGVHHALDMLSPKTVAACIAAFRFFGLTKVEGTLKMIQADPELSKWTDVTEREANRLYTEHVSDDDILITAFDDYFWANQDDFEPVD